MTKYPRLTVEKLRFLCKEKNGMPKGVTLTFRAVETLLSKNNAINELATLEAVMWLLGSVVMNMDNKKWKAKLAELLDRLREHHGGNLGFLMKERPCSSK